MMTSGIEFGIGVEVSPVLWEFFRPWSTMTFNKSDGDLYHSTAYEVLGLAAGSGG